MPKEWGPIAVYIKLAIYIAGILLFSKDTKYVKGSDFGEIQYGLQVT